MVGTSLLSPIIYLLVRAFPHQSPDISKKVYGISIGFALISAAISVSPLLFSGVVIENGQISPKPEFGIAFFGITYFGFLAAAIITSYRKMRKATGMEKKQLEFLFYGIVTTFLLIGFTNFIMVNAFNNSSLVVLGPHLTLLLNASIAYAIIKHRFLDIRFVIAKTAAYTLLVLIVAIFYTGSIFFVSNWLFTGELKTYQALVYTILTLFVAYTFQPLKRFLEKITDRIFYQGKYDSNELLEKLTKIMATTIELEDVSKKTLKELLDTIHISSGAFLIFNSRGFYPLISKGINIEIDQKTINWLHSLNKLIIFEEESEQVKKEMRRLNLSVILPLKTHSHFQGYLLLGEKKSGEIYSNQDIEVLEIFGPEISVTLENTKSYEEIKKFNITLKEEVQRATHDLRKANERLRELDKLKDEFVSLSSHELRTPMTAVKYYLWTVLNDKKTKVDPEQKSYLEQAYSSTERLIKLVNDMLNLSRIESGKITVTPSEIDIRQLFEEVISEVKPVAEKQGLTVKENIAKETKTVINADKDKIKEVLINLIGNSIKFTSDGGKIIIGLGKKENQLVVSVSDTGKGIAKEDMPKLFRKFGMLQKSYDKIKAHGTGLGLYISKSIVELHGGKMWAESDGENKGSTFYFTLDYETKEKN